MLKRKSTNHTIAWFSDQERAQKLDMDPPYQRGDLVWSKEYQAYYIDTILRNYPSPAIFLHAETSDSGITTYHVVDGKQRLTTIFGFVNGQFIIPSKFKGPYPETEFSELPSDVKKSFWEYDIPVQEVTTESEQELREAFDRLNRNVARLSKQELRHAAFAGEFASLMEQLADEPFWGDIGISTRANARRMKDVEIVSEIFLLTMHGIQEGTQSKVLDGYYSLYDDEIPAKEEYLRQYRNAIRVFETLGLPDLRNSRFSNVSDFYSLWAAFLSHLNHLEQIDYATTLKALVKFETDYDKYVKAPDQFPKRRDLAEYSNSARQGVNKASNRQTRTDILAALIKCTYDHS